MSVKLNSSGGGSVTLQEPTTASDFTLTLPAQTATVITDSSAILNIGSGQIYKDASGNVGIGTSSPSAKLQVAGNVIVGTTSAGATLFLQNTSTYWTLEQSTSNFIITNTGTERARIDSSGNLLVGTTSSTGYRLSLESADNQYTMRNSGATAGKRWRFSCDTNNTVYIINQNSAGVYMGDGSSSWSGLSDERAKDIIEPIQDAANKVCQLRAVIGKYKIDDEGTRRSFLIAQDVQSVLPEAVSVANQETGHLGLSYTDVIPLLVAAIQELKAELDAAKVEIAALKGSV